MNEKQFEQAQAIEEAARREGIAKIQRECANKGTPECIECGDSISAKRRAAVPHAQRCAACQTIHEKARKNGR